MLNATECHNIMRKHISFRLALTSLAKHHAISYAFIKSLGGPEVFFQKFPKLDFEPFCQAIPVEILGYIMEIGIVRDCSILEVIFSPTFD